MKLKQMIIEIDATVISSLFEEIISFKTKGRLQSI